MGDDAGVTAADSGEDTIPSAASEQWAGFSDVWRKGYRYIYTIRLVRGRLPMDDRVTRHWSRLVRWLGLAYGPGILVLVALFTYRPWWPSLDRIILIAELGTINAGAFAAAALAWGFALKRTGAIDEVLRSCSNRGKIVGVIGRAVDHDRQAVLPIVFAALPWIGAGLQGDFAHDAVIPLVLMLLNITWSMALIANVSYWLLVPPLIAIRMARSREIELRWNDPARTPGIRVLSEGYAYPAFFLALGALALTGPRIANYPLFGRYLPYLYAWLLILSLWVGVLTQVCIYTIVRRFKLGVLDELTSGRDFLLSARRSREIISRFVGYVQFKEQLSVYERISTAPALPFGTATIVQYVAAIIGSLTGFLLN